MPEYDAVAAAAAEAATGPPKIKSVPEARVIGLRAIVPNYRAQKTLWAQVLAVSSAQGLAIAGPCFTIYYDQGFKEKDVDMEVCLPIAMDAQVKDEADLPEGVSVRLLPALPRVASAAHVGSYDELNLVYQKLYEWIATEALRPSEPVREVYLHVDSSDASEASFVTEIQQPVA